MVSVAIRQRSEDHFQVARLNAGGLIQSSTDQKAGQPTGRSPRGSATVRIEPGRNDTVTVNVHFKNLVRPVTRVAGYATKDPRTLIRLAVHSMITALCITLYHRFPEDARKSTW